MARELGIHFEERPQVTAAGAVRMDYMFSTAKRRARYGTLCYLPCDTVLLPDFCDAVNRVEALYREFLMVGRAHRLDNGAALHFGDPDWRGLLREQMQPINHKHSTDRAAYVAFSRGACLADLPPLAMDSPLCTEWLLWRVLSDQVTAVDASDVVLAVRQQDEVCSAAGESSERTKAEAESLALCGGAGHLRTVTKATYLLTARDVVRNRWPRWHAGRAHASQWKFRARRAWQQAWQFGKNGGPEMLRGVHGSSTPRADGKALAVTILTE